MYAIQDLERYCFCLHSDMHTPPLMWLYVYHWCNSTYHLVYSVTGKYQWPPNNAVRLTSTPAQTFLCIYVLPYNILLPLSHSHPTHPPFFLSPSVTRSLHTSTSTVAVSFVSGTDVTGAYRAAGASDHYEYMGSAVSDGTSDDYDYLLMTDDGKQLPLCHR